MSNKDEKPSWAVLQHERCGTTLYQLADIEKSVSLEVFRNRTEVSFRDVLCFASEESWIKRLLRNPNPTIL